ncbi:MAG: C69 family dipeptidase [Thermodesulfobacteriota bacterium]
MCDVLVAMPDYTKNGTVVFGKNSDRPAGECQVLYSSPGGPRKPGSVIQCSYVAVSEANHVFSTLGCRPYWCWGYETGINEAGVVGGNTAVFTRSLRHRRDQDIPGLTGMDLLRLGLERSKTAEEAVQVIVNLLEKYGQWGSAVQGQDHGEGSYENAFLIADRNEAWILETSGRRWVSERITEGVRSISNELSIRNHWTKANEDIQDFALEQGWWSPDAGPFDFALAYSDHEHYARQVSHIRRMRSLELLHYHKGVIDVPIMMRMLRDHYEDTFLQGPQFHPFLPDFHTICMHESPAGFTWGNTATSFIVEINQEDSGTSPCWVCYLPPCIGIYLAYGLFASLPETVTRPGTAGLSIQPAPQAPADKYSESSFWWRFNRIVGEIKRNPLTRRHEIRKLLDPIERRNLDLIEGFRNSPPERRQQEFSTLIRKQVADVTAALDLLELQWDVRQPSR